MKIFFLFLLLSFLGFGQITFNEPKTQIKNEVLNLYLDYDNNSFISKQELKFADFLKLDSERDDNWYSEFKGIYTKKPYEYSGYDLGHLTPSHITSYDNKVNHHSFSFYNQAPQLAGFNRGKWARLERGMTFMVKSLKGYRELIQFFREGGCDPWGEKTKDKIMILSPVEQYLVSKEKRLFKGFEDYNQVTRLVFDLETTALEPKDGRIFMIGIGNISTVANLQACTLTIPVSPTVGVPIKNI